MNLPFLHQELWGISLMVYIRFAAILMFALLLKRYITTILTKLFFTVFSKFSSGFFGQHFKELMIRPIEGLIVSVLFYIAFNQLGSTFDQIELYKRHKPAAGNVPESTFIISMMDVIDHLFFLFLLFYFVLLISRVMDFLFLVLVDKAKEKQDKERQQILPLLKDVLKVVVWAFGVLSVMGVVFHVNVAALIAGLGVGGIAIAFAAKESLENLLASFMVMIDKPFTLGDWIKVAGVEGNVEKVGFRSTRIRSFDKSIISIPNRKLIDDNLENFSERGMRRVVFSIGAVYGLSKATLEQTMESIRALIVATEGTTGVPTVQLEGFGDSSVNIQVVYFVAINTGVDFGKVREQVYFGVYEAMYQHAKGFAFPTQLGIIGADINEVFPPKQP